MSPMLRFMILVLAIVAASAWGDDPSMVEPRELFEPPAWFYPSFQTVLEGRGEGAGIDDSAAGRNGAAVGLSLADRASLARLDPGVSSFGPRMPTSPGDESPEIEAVDNPGTHAAGPAEAARVSPSIQVPELGEVGLEAFAIAPRGSEEDALIVAFYGHPRSKAMGILGEYPLQQMARKLMAVAKQYDDANGPQPVLPAFHIIYATVFENADVGILNEEILLRYIEFAEEHGFVVFIDHQLGRHDVLKSVQSMLPYLRYESVHLAIDPEWSTPKPGREIGSVTAQEINDAQQLIQDYLIDHDLPGNRMFVVHQFNWRMIEDREMVRTDFDRVRLVHNADGFGSPAAKIDSWEFNLLARNIPVKGFKLFYPKSWRDGGFDHPLMTVEEVMELEPRPAVIMYQ